MMIDLHRHTRISLTYFFIAALLGVFLRFFFVVPVNANFRFVVHAHSHVALLGWVYLALITLIHRLYIPSRQRQNTYKRIFWFTQVTLIGMLITFPFTGYALFSIIFSTLFLIASYFAAWFFLKRIPAAQKRSYSYKCIRAGLWYMVFSSIGPWAIGGVMATLGKTSIWYKLSIYFYLHFQYNGWFILTLCGILIYFLERRGSSIDPGSFKRFFYLLNSGVILSLSLSALWLEPHWIFYALGALGAVLQLMAFLEFPNLIRGGITRNILPFTPFEKLLLAIAWILLVGKLAMQVVSAIPFFAELTFRYPDLVIGYLHWTFLGLVSISLFAFLSKALLLRLPGWLFWIYFTGFLLSEGLIFYKAISLWTRLPFFSEYFLLLTLASTLLPLSLAGVLLRNLRKPT